MTHKHHPFRSSCSCALILMTVCSFESDMSCSTEQLCVCMSCTHVFPSHTHLLFRFLEPTFADNLAQTFNTVVFVSRRRGCSCTNWGRTGVGWGLLCTHPLSTVRQFPQMTHVCGKHVSCLVVFPIVKVPTVPQKEFSVFINQHTQSCFTTNFWPWEGGGADGTLC